MKLWDFREIKQISASCKGTGCVISFNSHTQSIICHFWNKIVHMWISTHTHTLTHGHTHIHTRYWAEAMLSTDRNWLFYPVNYPQIRAECLHDNIHMFDNIAKLESNYFLLFHFNSLFAISSMNFNDCEWLGSQFTHILRGWRIDTEQEEIVSLKSQEWITENRNDQQNWKTENWFCCLSWKTTLDRKTKKKIISNEKK